MLLSSSRVSTCLSLIIFFAGIVSAGLCRASETDAKPIPDEPVNVSSTESVNESSLSYLVYGFDNGPFQIVGDEAEVFGGGFITELVNVLLTDVGVQSQTMVKPIKRIKRDMIDGQYKPWITYAMRGWEHLPQWKSAHFMPQNLFAYTLSQVTYRDTVAPVSSPRDFRDKRFLLIRGFDYAHLNSLLEKHGALCVYADNFAQALRMLKHGRADIFLGFDKRVNFVLKQQALRAEDFLVSPFMNGRMSTQATLMVSGDVPQALVDKLSSQLQVLINDGRWQDIWQRY